jgi:hypothetical protein
MNIDNKNTEVNNTDKKLHISDVISRLSNLETYYMDIVDKSDLDGPEVKGRKSTYGSWVRLDDVRKIIDELKNDL